MKSLVSRADYEALISTYDTWMFDCDGVLWHGDRLIEGAVDVLSHLRSQSACHPYVCKSDLSCKLEKNIIFVTNNATKSRQSYKGKFDKLGVQVDVVRVRCMIDL